MFKSATPDDRFSENGGPTQNDLSHEAKLSGEQIDDDDSWQPIHFPGLAAIDDISRATPNLQPNAMDSSSIQQENSTFELSASEPSTVERPHSKREAELLGLVRDLNECNDVLLVKVSELEESLERSQSALQAEIDRSGGGDRIGDREIVQLVTELEQSTQALQHQQMLNDTLQSELTAFRTRATQLEAEHSALLRQNTEQGQELLQASTDCRDLRARLQRQQRYTLQFKAALEKCLSMSTHAQGDSEAAIDPASLAMPKTDEIRPWEAASLGQARLDPQLESIIRGLHGNAQTNPAATVTNTMMETQAEDQLWHDLARVMDPDDVVSEADAQIVVSDDEESPQFTEPSSQFTEPSSQFTEPSPWTDDASVAVPQDDSADDSAENKQVTPRFSSQLSPQASEILARVQASGAMTVDTYLPAMSSTQGSPSPLVKPLRPQKRVSSLSSIDLPNFPRLKKQPPAAKA
ncbi:MAG: hypothetical protein KTR27_12015 [Leptolyngbyaceae cyanobacterium MAG.088]|nr:hypothetical protein [Leptolyngbyaceae cyanobacterium MAG.088]